MGEMVGFAGFWVGKGWVITLIAYRAYWYRLRRMINMMLSVPYTCFEVVVKISPFMNSIYIFYIRNIIPHRDMS